MMDDIYGDLENYDDVNAVAELRNENKELKLRLQEHAECIDRLQKSILQDLDKLQSEFNKLQINYSSLLKTARAEVERKTQIITNLNKEKDMMVLNAIQNSDRSFFNRRRNMNRDRSDSFKRGRKDIDSDCDKSSKVKKDFSEIKNNPERDRNEDNRMPSVDTFSSANTEESNNLTHIEDRPVKLEPYNDKNNENVAKAKNKAQGVRNRRKSMPTVSKVVKLSSDEEFEELYSAEQAKMNNARDGNKNKRVFEKDYNVKKSHKVSETSGIDEKYSSYHESSRETYYNSRPFKHSDKYRSRDKYEPSLRHKRYFSPERSHKRSQRNYSDEHYQRSEYGRHYTGVLESPPPERYDTQRRNRERRSNYEKDHLWEERQKQRYEKYSSKSGAQSDYDEPSSKRLRRDSYNKHHEEEKSTHKDFEVTKEQAMSNTLGQLRHISCQSPDDDHFETVSTQPVREIMNVAATQLEDPRLSSKKYITQNEDTQIFLSTLTGRNVDLKPVDKSSWNLEQVGVPEALQKPPQFTDKLVDELYSNIDDPVTNVSMESGEIHSETNDSPLADIVTESILNSYESEASERNRKAKVIHKQEKQIVIPIEIDTSKPKKYTIPKIKRPDCAPQGVATDVALPKDVPTVNEGTRNKHEHVAKDKSSDKPFINNNENKLDLQNRGFSVDTTDNIKTLDSKKMLDDIKAVDNTKTIDNTKGACPLKQRNLSTHEIVENDLELSDESSDFVEVCKSKTKVKTLEIINRYKPENSDPPKFQGQIVDNKSEMPSQDEFKKSKTDDTSNTTEERTEVPARESIKKQKMKRKSLKHKGKSSKETSKSKIEKVIDKTTKSKKNEKSKPQAIKAKFSDLFGDSSSLITPEDLGLPLTQVQPQSSGVFVSVFEDAQDAIDVIVEDKKVQATSSEAKVGAIVKETCENGNKEVVHNYKIDNIDKKEDKKVQATSSEAKVGAVVKETCKSGNKGVVHNYKIDKIDKLTLKLKKEKSNKEDELKSIISEEPTKGKNIYENLITNSECEIKEPDVVKTVIISTGVQPQTMSKDSVEFTNRDSAQNVKNIHNENVTVPKITVTPMDFATSTAHKEIQLKQLENEIDSRITDSSCNSNDSKQERTDFSVIDQPSSVANGMQYQNDEDIPDVRIFVRRRRKLVKKATSST